ncbi:MAG: STAS domain-containing protein [Thermodesulfobacteriota bacterium]
MQEKLEGAAHQIDIYEKILDNVEEEIMLLDKDFRILWANKKVLAAYGLDPASITSKLCYKVTHQIDHVCKPPHDTCPIEQVQKTGNPTTVLHIHFDRAGRKVYAEVTAYPVYENGAISEYIHISRNVTERVVRDEKLKEHQKALLELSTPVIKLWEGIIILPLIGIIDSMRAKQIMENLLAAIMETQAGLAIIDITGVPMVDTEVADRLIKTVKAASLLGTKCIMVGIKPDIAQSIVNIGIDLTGIETFSNLQAGLRAAFKQIGWQVTRK